MVDEKSILSPLEEDEKNKLFLENIFRELVKQFCQPSLQERFLLEAIDFFDPSFVIPQLATAIEETGHKMIDNYLKEYQLTKETPAEFVERLRQKILATANDLRQQREAEIKELIKKILDKVYPEIIPEEEQVDGEDENQKPWYLQAAMKKIETEKKHRNQQKRNSEREAIERHYGLANLDNAQQKDEISKDRKTNRAGAQNNLQRARRKVRYLASQNPELKSKVEAMLGL